MDPFLSHVCDWGLCSGVVSPAEVEVQETGGAAWSGNSTCLSWELLRWASVPASLFFNTLARQKYNSAWEPGIYYADILQFGWKEIRFNLSPFNSAVSVILLKPGRRIKKRAPISKNWTGAMLHLKQKVSKLETETMKPPWILPVCKCVLMCKVGHLFGAGTAIVFLSWAMSEWGISS